jgi:hypothetical protein
MSKARQKRSLAIRTEGLDGESLALVQNLNKRFEELDLAGYDDVATEVRTVLGGLMNESGEWKVKPDAIAELLGDGEKSLITRMKKQGEELAKLKQVTEEKPLSFRAHLQKNKKAIEEVFVNGQGEVKFDIRAAAIMTTENVVDGLDALPDDLIESFSVGGFVEKRQDREYIYDIATRTTVARIEKYKTWLSEGGEEGVFAEVAEGGLKPLLSAGLVRNYSQAFKVAGKYVVTEELSKFMANVYNIIRRLIMQKVQRDYAKKLTDALVAAAAPYVASALDDQYPAAKVTDYHAIAAVAAQIGALNFTADVLIMNPQDKWRIGMSSDANGQFYLTIPTTDPAGVTRMMGFRVVESNRIPVGSFILGESGLWEIEDETVTVRIGYGVEVTKDLEGKVTEVESDVDHNRFRVIVETFAHSYIDTNYAGSFVLAEFDTVKAAVTAP